jgi:hypothetical protein
MRKGRAFVYGPYKKTRCTPNKKSEILSEISCGMSYSLYKKMCTGFINGVLHVHEVLSQDVKPQSQIFTQILLSHRVILPDPTSKRQVRVEGCLSKRYK